MNQYTTYCATSFRDECSNTLCKKAWRRKHELAQERKKLFIRFMDYNRVDNKLYFGCKDYEPPMVKKKRIRKPVDSENEKRQA